MVAPDWRPSASPRARQLRARVYRQIRQFFDDRGVLEVETPVISIAGNTDPNIESLVADGDQRWYLRTSPEFPLKRLLADGSGPIYELGRVFRRGESGRWHNPEFTMLEWYRPGFDHQQLAAEVLALVQATAEAVEAEIGALRTASYSTVGDWISPGLDPLHASTDAINAVLRERGWYDRPLERRDALDLLMAFGVAQVNGPREVLAVFDFPPELAALARIDGEPPVARRFEVYLGGQELANGYHELTDPDELARRFEAENITRCRRKQTPVAMDTRLIEAQRHGLPDCAGVALGVDRLIAWLGGWDTIDAVVNFPASRA